MVWYTLTKGSNMSEEKLTKAEQFEKDPDSFIHLSEIIVAVKKEEDDINKISVFLGEQSEFRLRGALGIIESRIQDLMHEMKYAAAIKAKQDSKITQAVQNIIKGK